MTGDGSLFGKRITFNSLKLEDNPNPLTKREKLLWEKELLGVFVSSHPMDDLQEKIKNTLPISEINSSFTSQKVRIAGTVSKIQKVTTKQGKPMLFLEIEDLTGRIEALIFPDILEENALLFQNNKILEIKGRISDKDGVPKIIAERVREVK